MSAVGAVPTRGFGRERAAIRIGRALVSWGERRERLEVERQALYRKLSFERYSATTPMSIEAVEAEIRRSAARGYHFSNGDFSADLVGVAFPLPVRHRRLRARPDACAGHHRHGA